WRSDMSARTQVAPAAGGQLATFWLDGDLYGVEVEHVQEVPRSQKLTRVPLAPPAVAGLINLRGQVVTAIELRERLGRPPRPEGTDAVVIVVRLHGEAVSLLVDSIADVVDVAAGDFEAPPDTLVSAATLGFDLVRLPAGRDVAEVLLTGLDAGVADLHRLAAAHPAEGRSREQRGVLAVRSRRARELAAGVPHVRGAAGLPDG